MAIDKSINGPRGYPLIGHLWHFERNRLGFLVDCFRRYGETVHFRIVVPTILINNPHDIQHVLIDREENYRKSRKVTGSAGQRMFGRGLLTGRGRAHGQRRRLVQPVFHRQALAVFFEAIRAHSDVMLDSWGEMAVVDLTTEMDRFAEQVLIRTLAGDQDEESRRRVSEANRTRRRFINDMFNKPFPWPHLLPTRRNWDYWRAVRSQRRGIRELVRRAACHEIDADSLVALMAAQENAEGRRLTEDELVAEVWELLTAGYETTREAMTWSAYLMATHPESARRVRAEVNRIAGQRPIQIEDVPRLVYAEMFFSEAIRLFPPAWMFVRVAVGDDVLPSGVRVPAGTKIYLCPFTAHRNVEYFPNPERFDPDRFQPETRHARPRFSYFPFGGGQRVCVAESLARLEGILVVASLARRFDLERCPGPAVEPVGAITLRPSRTIRVIARPASAQSGARDTVSGTDSDG